MGKEMFQPAKRCLFAQTFVRANYFVCPGRPFAKAEGKQNHLSQHQQSAKAEPARCSAGTYKWEKAWQEVSFSKSAWRLFPLEPTEGQQGNDSNSRLSSFHANLT